MVCLAIDRHARTILTDFQKSLKKFDFAVAVFLCTPGTPALSFLTISDIRKLRVWVAFVEPAEGCPTLVPRGCLQNRHVRRRPAPRRCTAGCRTIPSLVGTCTARRWTRRDGFAFSCETRCITTSTSIPSNLDLVREIQTNRAWNAMLPRAAVLPTNSFLLPPKESHAGEATIGTTTMIKPGGFCRTIDLPLMLLDAYPDHINAFALICIYRVIAITTTT